MREDDSGWRGVATMLGLLGSLAACTPGSPAFSLTGATVDPSYICPAGASNAHYDLHATIEADNGTSNAVTIESISAVMKVESVHGPWVQKVGDTYDAGSAEFAPSSVGAGSKASINVTVPSACTSGPLNGTAAYADYSVAFTVTTSAGTYRVNSTGRHRILA